MGIVNWLSLGGIIIDLVVISIIISSTYLGYRKGLVGVIFKIISFIVSLVIVFLLYKPVSNLIINGTQIDEKLASAIETSLSQTNLINGEKLDSSNTNLSSGIINIINDFLDESINQTTISSISYISLELSYIIIRGIIMLLIFAFAKFLLLIIRFATEILASLPIIKMFNKSGGLIYGIIKGLLIVYLILAIISLISPIINSWGILSSLEKSFIASKMYNNNILLNLISK